MQGRDEAGYVAAMDKGKGEGGKRTECQSEEGCDFKLVWAGGLGRGLHPSRLELVNVWIESFRQKGLGAKALMGYDRQAQGMAGEQGGCHPAGVQAEWIAVIFLHVVLC